MKNYKQIIFRIIIGILVIFFNTPAIPAHAQEVRSIIFPVLGSTRYSDDFGAGRSGGRTHEGNDIMGYKGEPLIAAVDGFIRSAPYPEPYWGYSITIEDKDGYEYNYYHVNNDNPGTDDGLGGGINAYYPNTDARNPVVAGQIIGWMGDSGNAEGTSPHLHFEIRRPDDTPIDPYESLQAAQRISQPTIPATLPDELLPFGQFPGSAHIAVGNVSPAAGEELVVGAGLGGGPHVRIYDSQNQLIGQFFALPTTFRGGIDVATGDVDGDGYDEIIIGNGPGADPEIRIFKGDGTLVTMFLAYPSGFRAGISVASADLNLDGLADIVTAPGPGGGPQVRIFDASGKVLGQFFAYNPAFRGGVDVAAVDATSESGAAIITGAGPGGGPHVRIFNPKAELIGQFMAYDTSFRGGVRVTAGNIQNKNIAPEIAVAPASGGGPNVRLYNLSAQLTGFNTNEFEAWWRGGYDLAAGTGTLRISSFGDRRATVRSLTTAQTTWRSWTWR
ncbi:MAG: FG-GAP-like repeat-containing protein [Patescibacteria group bacterium]|jgi:hypothetical protein